jgi:serine/threonine protein kinase
MAQAGEVLGGYRLLEPLGRGGMGEVWRAEHVALGRAAAVKLIALDGMDPAQLQARFEREARATAALTSPHTIDIYDYGQTADGRFFYAMPLLQGLDLQVMVQRHGPLPPARVLHFLRQACRSLAEAHAAGLVHRDIKPANLFACRQGLEWDVLKVLDFGLVRSQVAAGPGQWTSVGAITGSPAFAAPEQILAGHEVDARTDVYGLGGVGFWLLTGEVPFPGTSAWEMVTGHLQAPPPLASLRSGKSVPADLEAVLLACLAKAPAQRPANAEALGQLLDGCADAGRWTSSQAAAWWREHGPDREGPGRPDESGVFAETVAESPVPQVPAIPPSEPLPAPMPDPQPEAKVAPPPQPGMRVAKTGRQAAIDRLGLHYAHSTIDLAEFERRVEKVQIVQEQAELDRLLADLPPLQIEQVPATPQVSGALAVPHTTPIVSIFGSVVRKGRWAPGRDLRVITVFGSAELDLREATLQPGVTELRVVCLFGNAEIIVPPGMAVEISALPVFGNVEDQARDDEPADPNAPRLRITGVVLFGNVEVQRRSRRTLR